MVVLMTPLLKKWQQRRRVPPTPKMYKHLAPIMINEYPLIIPPKMYKQLLHLLLMIYPYQVLLHNIHDAVTRDAAMTLDVPTIVI
jgi:hypothetical protein